MLDIETTHGKAGTVTVPGARQAETCAHVCGRGGREQVVRGRGWRMGHTHDQAAAGGQRLFRGPSLAGGLVGWPVGGCHMGG